MSKPSPPTKPNRRKPGANKLEPIDWHEYANDAVLNGNMSTLFHRPPTEDPSSYASRVAEFTDVTSRDGCMVDALGHTIEDFGLTDNLIMIHALDLHGCALVTPRQAPADIWHDLAAFETCVRLAAERLAAAAHAPASS